MQILIVDDNSTNRKLLRVSLEAEGHDTLEADDGQEALRHLDGGGVDAIISDILMPHMDGYRLCFEVRRSERFRALPFIFFTSTYTSPSDERFALEIGADRFIRKPAAPKEILAALQSLSEGSQKPRQTVTELMLAKDFSELLVGKLQEKNAELLRKAEDLRVAQGRLNSFFRAATAGLCILDAGFRYLQINETLAAMNGIPAKEHLGRTVREIVPAMAPKLEVIFRRVMQTSKPALDQEVTGEIPSQPGSMRHWLASYFPLPGAGGKPEALGAIVVEITERKQAEEKLHRSEEQLRALAARLHQVREEERLRIAREIHDELGQALTSLNLDVIRLRQKFAGKLDSGLRTGARRRLKAMEALLFATARSVQRISSELRPGILDDLGLVAAMQWQAEQFQNRTGIRCRWKRKPQAVELTPELTTALFRIFQEILTNAARHARARTVTLDFRQRERKGELVLEITDDGKGFDPNKLSDRKSLGLLGMRERALLIGGRVEIRSAPGKGTGIRTTVPYAAPKLQFRARKDGRPQ